MSSTLASLPTPALILDRRILEANLDLDRAAAYGRRRRRVAARQRLVT